MLFCGRQRWKNVRFFLMMAWRRDSCSVVRSHGHAQGTSERLEGRLGHVVVVATPGLEVQRREYGRREAGGAGVE